MSHVLEDVQLACERRLKEEFPGERYNSHDARFDLDRVWVRAWSKTGKAVEFTINYPWGPTA